MRTPLLLATFAALAFAGPSRGAIYFDSDASAYNAVVGEEVHIPVYLVFDGLDVNRPLAGGLLSAGFTIQVLSPPAQVAAITANPADFDDPFFAPLAEIDPAGTSGRLVEFSLDGVVGDAVGDTRRVLLGTATLVAGAAGISPLRIADDPRIDEVVLGAGPIDASIAPAEISLTVVPAPSAPMLLAPLAAALLLARSRRSVP